MLKKMIGLAGCVALTLSFTGCPAEEAKGPNENAADQAKENAEEKADDTKKDADAAAADATKKAGE